MLDVIDGLFQERCHVIVMERIQDVSSSTLRDDKTEVAKRAELMGDGGLLHLHRLCQLANRAWRFGESPEDATRLGAERAWMV